MKLLGNYADWINPRWIDFVKQNRGTARPQDGGVPKGEVGAKEWQKVKDAGYSDNDIYFYMFDKSNTDFDIVNLPWTNKNFHWWIIKMLPGNFMPVHVDPHTLREDNSERFWIPLQNWDIGHIFVYENTVAVDYKKGDVWQYSNAAAQHGAANIGYTTRLVLQVSTYD